jgi:hypothetical protein
VSDSQTKEQAIAAFTPSQRKTFDELLAVGGTRPTAPEDLSGKLADIITAGTVGALSRWTERSLWMGKSQISTVMRCEGQTLAEAGVIRDKTMHPATAVGIVSHRAIQIAHTHPGEPILAYVEAAINGAREEDAFSEFWDSSSLSAQSDLVTSSISKVASFLDSWPPLSPAWTPRFEESVQARLGKLTLSARIDLTIGRPRAGGLQTMLLCDLKSGGLNDDHEGEASFYALVATLRNGVPPWRSIVYSLASGEYTVPDVTPERLVATAELVVEAVGRYVDVLTEAREPTLTPDRYCAWCPARTTCAASEFRITEGALA